MDIYENILESLRSMRANILRSVLTIFTIVIGITCLVGMLTAIESMRQTYLNEYARLGVNNFSIKSINNWRRRRRGELEREVSKLSYAEVLAFTKEYPQRYGLPSIRLGVSGSAKLTRGSKKTNPNIRVSGIDAHFLRTEFLELEYGRNFTTAEVNGGSNVVIIGEDVYTSLFTPAEDPIGIYIFVYGMRYKVIGKLKAQGASNDGKDRLFLISLQAARRILKSSQPHYEIIVQTHTIEALDEAMEEGRGLMRKIRGDRSASEDSFEMGKSNEAEKSINATTATLLLIGYLIGAITLGGACIGLMNVMLVYVKERTREIGLRKALGATAFEIRMQFLTEAVLICQVGGLGGILMGLVTGNIIAIFAETNFIFPLTPVLISLLLSTIVGVIAGYAPARQAAKVDPIISLRYE